MTTMTDKYGTELSVTPRYASARGAHISLTGDSLFYADGDKVLHLAKDLLRHSTAPATLVEGELPPVTLNTASRNGGYEYLETAEGASLSNFTEDAAKSLRRQALNNLALAVAVEDKIAADKLKAEAAAKAREELKARRDKLAQNLAKESGMFTYETFTYATVSGFGQTAINKIIAEQDAK